MARLAIESWRQSREALARLCVAPALVASLSFGTVASAQSTETALLSPDERVAQRVRDELLAQLSAQPYEEITRRIERLVQRQRRLRRRRSFSRARVATREARAAWPLIVGAAIVLERIEPQTADANGQVRDWDARFRSGMEMLAELQRFAFGTNDCREKEVAFLLAAQEVVAARPAVLDSEFPLGADDPHLLMLKRLAQRRLLADEARRRREEGLSCEDLTDERSVEPPIPELLQTDPGSATLIALLGSEGIDIARSLRADEPEWLFARVQRNLSPQRRERLMNEMSRPMSVPGCGDRTSSPSAIWRELGVEESTWFAYTVEESGGLLFLRATGDADCDGQHETRRIALRSSGEESN